MSENHRNPLPTVDIIIELAGGGVVLIERKNFPQGWALPGGFVDYGESLEAAAVREAEEETSLKVQLIEQFYAYSDPSSRPATPHDIHGIYRHSAGNPARSRRRQDSESLCRRSAPEPDCF